MLAPTVRDPSLHTVKFTDARNLSPLFDEAVRDEQPVMIVRSNRERGVLMSREAMRRVLAPFRLHVDVLPEDEGGFTLWLRELNVGGSGQTLEAAREGLLLAVRSYVRDYHQQFGFCRHLTDMAAQEPYVLRLSLALDDAELIALLFSASSDSTPGNAT